VNAAALDAAQASGLLACALLLVTLSISPLSALLPSWRGPSARAKALRRRLGIGSACLALVHAAVAFVGRLDAQPSALLQTSQLYAGWGALGVLMLLLLTSFPTVVRRLRLSTWKEFHRLVYLAALLVVQHVLLSPFADRRLVLGLGAALLALFGARVVLVLRAR
jgi:sulfoxide reductase heme-binding subunit YedZ